MLYRRFGGRFAWSTQFEESLGGGCGSRRWAGNWPDSYAPDSRRFGRKPDSVRAGFGRTRRRHSHRGLVGLLSPGTEGLYTPDHVSPRQDEDSIGADAESAPGRL